VPDLPGWALALVVAIAVYIAFIAALVVSGRRAMAREAALFIPNLIGLFRGLVADPSVPWHAKVVLALGLTYLAMPIDLVPDMIPVVGHLDDAIVAALVLGYVVRVSGRDTVERHWRGDPAVIRRLLRSEAKEQDGRAP